MPRRRRPHPSCRCCCCRGRPMWTLNNGRTRVITCTIIVDRFILVNSWYSINRLRSLFVSVFVLFSLCVPGWVACYQRPVCANWKFHREHWCYRHVVRTAHCTVCSRAGIQSKEGSTLVCKWIAFNHVHLLLPEQSWYCCHICNKVKVDTLSMCYHIFRPDFDCMKFAIRHQPKRREREVKMIGGKGLATFPPVAQPKR